MRCRWRLSRGFLFLCKLLLVFVLYQTDFGWIACWCLLCWTWLDLAGFGWIWVGWFIEIAPMADMGTFLRCAAEREIRPEAVVVRVAPLSEAEVKILGASRCRSISATKS